MLQNGRVLALFPKKLSSAVTDIQFLQWKSWIFDLLPSLVSLWHGAVFPFHSMSPISMSVMMHSWKESGSANRGSLWRKKKPIVTEVARSTHGAKYVTIIQQSNSQVLNNMTRLVYQHCDRPGRVEKPMERLENEWGAIQHTLHVNFWAPLTDCAENRGFGGPLNPHWLHGCGGKA
jgi:hypothetical protein